MSRLRAALARLALASVSTLASLLLAEGVYRAHLARSEKTSDDAWRERVRRMNRTIYQRADDPALVYQPAPGAHVEMPYGTAGFNLAGMRDDREHDPAPGDRTRVAMLGDSVVWSEEVSLNDSLPRAVERALGARYEVLNFGVSGYDTAQEALWYERAARRFRPSVVVVVYCLNDAMLMSGPYNRFATPAEAARKDAQDALWDALAPRRAETVEALARRRAQGAPLRMLSDVRTWAEVRRYERSAEYTDEYLLSHAQPDRARRVRESLAALGGAIRADGARAVLVISPVLRGWEHYHWRPVHAEVGRWAREAGFEVRDPLDAWRAREQAGALRLPGDALHYSARGNERFGRFIAEAVGSGR